MENKRWEFIPWVNEYKSIMREIHELSPDAEIPLRVCGEKGKFYLQILNVALNTCIKVIDDDEAEGCPFSLEELDEPGPYQIQQFFGSKFPYAGYAPCVIEAIAKVASFIPSNVDASNITVVGRGYYGIWAVTYFGRRYGRVTWQSAVAPIEPDSLVINCSNMRAEELILLDWGGGKTPIIDIQRIGRLTTAILLQRCIYRHGGQIRIK